MIELGQNSFTRLFVLEATFTSFYKERHALLLCMSLFTYIIYHVSVNKSSDNASYWNYSFGKWYPSSWSNKL